MSGRSILLFDEPTSGIDGGNMFIIAKAFKEAAQSGKTTVLVVTPS